MVMKTTALAAPTDLNDEAGPATGQSTSTQAFCLRVAERRKEIRALRILIATESDFQHKMFGRLFRQAGAQTVHVHTSDQALDALEATPFLLAVIDDCGRKIDASWTLNVYHWCSVMAGRARAPIMLLYNNLELAQRMERAHSNVRAIESNATKILQLLDSIDLLRH